jgi:hypothetical protein
MEKSKNFINKPLTHSVPFSALKPFNSTFNNKNNNNNYNININDNSKTQLLTKKRITNNNPYNQQFNKENISGNLKKIELNTNKTPNKNSSYSNNNNNKFNKSKSKSPIKKFSFINEKNYYRNNYLNTFTNTNLNNNFRSMENNDLLLDEENTINYLTSKIEKNCFISNKQKYKSNNNIRSPYRKLNENKQINKANLFNNNNYNNENECEDEDIYNDNFINYKGESALKELNIENKGDKVSFLYTNTNKSNFPNNKNKKNFESFAFGVELNRLKNQETFKDLNKENNKDNIKEYESFNKVIEKSRQDKFIMDNIEKERIKKEKFDLLKKSRFLNNNNNNNNNNLNLKSKKSNLINKDRKKINCQIKSKIVSFDELMSLSEN